MKRWSVFSLLWLSICGVYAQEYSSLSADIFAEAKSITETMKESHYDHQTSIEEKEGIYRTDCSAFVCHLLKKVAPQSLASLPIDKHHIHARAKNFYEYLHQLGNASGQNGSWKSIQKMSELQIGDIIAWKYDPSLNQKDTGHVVVIFEKPLLEENAIYRIRVVDASKGKHGNDSRAKEGRDGIGIGDMWFKVDTMDQPIGLYWSSREKKESNYPIAMGRALKSL